MTQNLGEGGRTRASSLAPDVRVSSLKATFREVLHAKQPPLEPKTIRSYMWAMNYHGEVEPLICWRPREVIDFVEDQTLEALVKQLLYDRLRVFYAWAGSWIKEQHPMAASLPLLPYVWFGRRRKGERRGARRTRR